MTYYCHSVLAAHLSRLGVDLTDGRIVQHDACPDQFKLYVGKPPEVAELERRRAERVYRK